jgi:hypothetical protein
MNNRHNLYSHNVQPGSLYSPGEREYLQTSSVYSLSSERNPDLMF